MNRTSKLSNLQKSILTMALKRGGGCLKARDVLREVYGFPVARIPTLPGGTMFSKKQIGRDRYNAATVAVCRSFSRLEARGLVERDNWRGFSLTWKGTILARSLGSG